MKLLGVVQGAEVVILVDSGATSNFISASLLRKLGLVCDSCAKFAVVLGTGKEVRGQDECRNVQLSFESITVTLNFLVLDLGHLDVVLGVQWLEILGPMAVDWKLQTVKF